MPEIIEFLKLKNDSTLYPISPVYRSPIEVNGESQPMDYPFQYDSEAAAAIEDYIKITIGNQETIFKLYPLTDHVFTLDERKAITVEGSNRMGQFYAEDPMISNSGSLIQAFLSMKGVTLDSTSSETINDPNDGLKGTGATLSIATFVFEILSFDNSADQTFTQLSGTYGDSPVTVAVELKVAKAGSYWLTTLYSSLLSSFSGTVNVCNYHFDPRFCNGVCKINNVIFATQLGELMEQGGGELSLAAYPTVSNKLLYALRAPQLLIISQGLATLVATVSVLDSNGYGGTWIATLIDPSNLLSQVITLTYAYDVNNPDNSTLTISVRS